MLTYFLKPRPGHDISFARVSLVRIYHKATIGWKGNNELSSMGEQPFPVTEITP